MTCHLSCVELLLAHGANVYETIEWEMRHDLKTTPGAVCTGTDWCTQWGYYGDWQDIPPDENERVKRMLDPKYFEYLWTRHAKAQPGLERGLEPAVLLYDDLAREVADRTPLYLPLAKLVLSYSIVGANKEFGLWIRDVQARRKAVFGVSPRGESAKCEAPPETGIQLTGCCLL